MKNSLIIKIFFFLIILSLQKCSIQTPEIVKNEYISVDVKEQIKKLNNKFFQGLKSRDFSTIKSLMADTILNMGIENNGFINTMSSVINTENYKVLDEFHIKNLAPGENTIIASGKADDNDYSLNFTPLNKETYISLLIPTGANQDFLVTIVYGKYNNKWEINILLFGQLKIYKKNTPDYIKLARTSLNKSELFEALNYLSLAKLISHPANDFFIYDKEKEIGDLEISVRKGLNTQYPLPYLLENIQTHPRIIGFSTYVIEEGYYPLIGYYTNINLDDTVALKVENDAIKSEVKRLIRGIYNEKKDVYFKAYNEMPNGTRLVKYHSFVDILKP